MSGESSFVLSKECDDMDIVMSQIKTGDLQFDDNVILVETMSVNGATSFAQSESDDMDEIMSQIDTEAMEQDQRMDEMDLIISQIDTEELQQEIDDISDSQEIIDEYTAALSEISEEVVNEMGQEDDIEHDIPPELMEEYHRAMDQIIPTKSGNRYQQAYDVFRKWQEAHRTNSFDEKIVLAYFGAAAKKYKPPTLWSIYSMLKKTLLCKHNVDLVKHCRLRAFLKMRSDGYEPKKANVFETEHLRKFFLEAPNDVYLGMKAVMIFGLCSGSRGCELTNLTLDNVKDDGKEVIVKIPMTKMKTKTAKLYVVGNDFAKIIRQYLDMRPASVTTDRLFLQWRKGKCIAQVMGKNSIAKIPKDVARFLKLPEPNSYTGHSYRRTTTTVAANAGFTVTELKRFIGWKSDRVCEGYIKDSVGYQRKLSKRLCDEILPSTSTGDISPPSFEDSDPLTIPVVTTIPALPTMPVLPAIPVMPTIPVVTTKPSTKPTILSSTIPEVLPFKVPAVRPSTNVSVPSTIPAAVQSPMSIQFDSSSGLTLSGAGKTLTLSGVDGSQNALKKEPNVIYHFGGDNNSFTIINMK
ncbi:uncharacterized protein LOC119083979 [Bradysia coprophila]|uniref:uncharacterized protein LOC119072129 n=1 Tax=Bradysia coprophila TaxID=38358 RepID=UPI00187D7068|nr:uncharacterized protein LOC119072129 [Bradysia coprophila]XP_037033166.1 uncharacterized protein LOC119072130 [Bradysia coprophila]XP_037049685.1 uncharacterized protein LOC119083979 [Bradysia coprophila]